MDDYTQNDPMPGMGEQTRKPRTWKFYAGIALVGLLLVALLTAWWVRRTFYAKEYQPVELSQKEEVVLEEKLEKLEALERGDVQVAGAADEPVVAVPGGSLEGGLLNNEKPEMIEEKIDPLGEDEGTPEERRHLVITEREINGFLHKNSDLADKVRIEFKEDTIRAGALIPFEEDAPFMGGKTLRCKLSVRALLDEDQRLAVYITDVTVGGVPIPNAWLGDLKDQNLVEIEGAGADEGMSRFAEGIRDFKISDGQVEIWLNE